MGHLTQVLQLPYGSAIGRIPAPQPPKGNLLLNAAYPIVGGTGSWAVNNGLIFAGAVPVVQWDAGFVPLQVDGNAADNDGNLSNSSAVVTAATVYTASCEVTIDPNAGVTDAEALHRVRLAVDWSGGAARTDYVDFDPASGLIYETGGSITNANVTPFSQVITNNPLAIPGYGLNGTIMRVVRVEFTCAATPAGTTAAVYRFYPRRLAPANGGNGQLIAGAFQLQEYPFATAFYPTNRFTAIDPVFGQIPRQDSNISYVWEVLTASRIYESIADNGKIWVTTTAGIVVTLGTGLANLQQGEHITIVNDSAGDISVSASNGMSIIYPGTLAPAANNTLTLGSGNRVTVVADVAGNQWEVINGASVSSVTSIASPEVPAGTIDGVNPTFTLTQTPNPAANLPLYLNRVYMVQGTDYTLAGNTITMLGGNIPQVGDVFTTGAYTY